MPITIGQAADSPAGGSGRAHHGGGVGFGEAELAVQVVCVAGEERPAEVGSRSLVDHRRHDALAQFVAAVRRQHEDVGEVGKSHAV
ncbi:hypothetical protein [Salinibacterium sp. ZJ450]|uniref:hypothetical protein n=1 Tax=Salinibacterium sp. ZJ450 TaxID=2708338 RepID=UPI002104B588|nr:hypothetical protein [Salinibacterium sp. ZJ450]